MSALGGQIRTISVKQSQLRGHRLEKSLIISIGRKGFLGPGARK